MRIFYSYSHRDEKMRDKLERHLSALKQSGVVSEWHDRKILAGDDFDHTISEHLEKADVILFLVSADFLASTYIREVEVKRAMERHKARAARVIPVVLRPVDLKGVPFQDLLRLPKDGLAVTEWKTQDSAFANIAQGIRGVAEQMGKDMTTHEGPVAESSIAKEPVFIEQQRSLDTGVADEIPIRESREVIAMIRRPESPGLVELLKKEESSDYLESSYTVRRKDVRTMAFKVFFPTSQGKSGGESLRVRVELRAPGLELSDSPMMVKVPRGADTGVLSFLVRSETEGSQTLKVRIVCDDEEVVSNLLRTKFVHHGGPGPTGPGLGMRLEADENGNQILVLAETELVIRLVGKKIVHRYMEA